MTESNFMFWGGAGRQFCVMMGAVVSYLAEDVVSSFGGGRGFVFWRGTLIRGFVFSVEFLQSHGLRPMGFLHSYRLRPMGFLHFLILASVLK